MRLFTVNRLLGALVLISTHANAENVLLDAHWKVVKDEKQALYYLKLSTEMIDGNYKTEVYYKNKDMLFCASALADNKIGKKITSEQFRGAYQCYFEDGKPYEQGFRNEQGQLHGLLKKYIATGQLYVETHYENGVKQGLETSYWEGGNIRYKASYQNGKEVGISELYDDEGKLRGKVCKSGTCVTQYYDNGNLHLEIPMVDGLKHGNETNWGFGKLLSTQAYVKDKKQGDYFEYFPDGKVERHYQYQADYKVGEQLTYYENGQIKLKEVTNDKGDVLQAIEYDDQGQIKKTTDSKYQGNSWVYRKQQRYRDGQLIETQEEDKLKNWSLSETFKKGLLIERQERLNKQLNGLQIKSFDYNDVITLSREYYEAGKREGAYETVKIEPATGKTQLVEQGQYAKDKQAGTWKKFQDDATLTYSHDDNGELHGEYLNKTNSGQLLESINFKHGKPDGLVQRYASNGQVYEKGEYRNGEQDGDWIFTDGEYGFRPIPNPERRYWYGRFDQGKRVGHWELRSSEDYVLQIANYDELGRLDGKQYEFEEHGWIRVINSYHNGQFLNQEMPPPVVTSDDVFPRF
ncbi:toxin-antitoxin system YwqK family antitoxin [Shewanella vaxholmensis]|uniref:toxin-antitoxin system YwqK family antitoxin n=1 Tax=Shewanella vaxholmensis TaxID=3063535 RepID=UPI0031967217